MYPPPRFSMLLTVELSKIPPFPEGGGVMDRGVQPRKANFYPSQTKVSNPFQKRKEENYNPCQNFSGLLFGYGRTTV